MAATQTAPIEFAGEVSTLGDRTIIRLSPDASAELPSRGQVAAEAVVGDARFATVVEPDGMRGHWLNLDEVAGLADGATVSVTLTPTKDWPEVSVPEDLASALADAGDLDDTWASLTPMARWEWVRWIKATKNPATRAKRVGVAIDKLENGKRRPCCFDLSSCTDPELSKSGKLIDFR
ncbi:MULTISPECIES: YdeI/OmpD-associated family protein [Brevibacterium]|uniref:YdeI/OmpD-associated family protein n=1 Tax=Brevibacterium TaxID=1696 RepID=UPI0031E1394C